MGIKTIVVGIDFSAESERAARQALEIARRMGSEVVLLHAGDKLERPDLGESASKATREALEVYWAQLDAALRAHRDQLAALRERLSGQGATISQVLSEDFPVQAIGKVARELGAELVVVGTHGRTGLRWFFLGSVAEAVVRTCPTDVLVARRDDAHAGGYRRICVATDFSPAAERALGRALDLAAPGAQIDVVHFLGIRFPEGLYGGAPFAPPPDSLERELSAAARERGESLLAAVRRPDTRMELLIGPGAPIPGIIHRVEAAAYDLVAVGRNGRRGPRELILGTAAQAVTRRAPCSVLITGAEACAATPPERARG